MFKEAIPPYQNALKSSGFDYKMKFEPTSTNNRKKLNRRRNITWFNPPSSNVATNVGAKVLILVDACFPSCHPLSKIINRNTVKVSYRCMPNMGKVLSRHNTKIANQDEIRQPPPGCNCRGGQAVCPLRGACLTEGVYEATVTRLHWAH